MRNEEKLIGLCNTLKRSHFVYNNFILNEQEECFHIKSKVAKYFRQRLKTKITTLRLLHPFLCILTIAFNHFIDVANIQDRLRVSPIRRCQQNQVHIITSIRDSIQEMVIDQAHVGLGRARRRASRPDQAAHLALQALDGKEDRILHLQGARVGEGRRVK